MKATDLEKNKGLKLASQLKQSTTPSRFGQAADQVIDRREQRRLDQLKGIIPFAVKIEGTLVEQIRTLAQTKGQDLNELVSELLKKGLEAK